MRQDYAGALSAAEKARRLSPSKLDDPSLSLQVFLAAFNGYMDRDAKIECSRIRAVFDGSWPGALCTVLLVGWAGAEYDVVALDKWVRDLDRDPDPVRTSVRPRLQALLAAAYARTGRRDKGMAT